MSFKTPAWQRKAGQSKAGGLNEAGRRSARAQGMNLKAPVKGMPSGPEQMRRKGSFLSRMGSSPGPEKKPNGEPTRLLLSLRAWGASSKADAKKKGALWLERYQAARKRQKNRG